MPDFPVPPPMLLGVCPQPFFDRSLPAALDAIAGLGLRALELPVHEGAPWFDAMTLATSGEVRERLRAALADRDLSLSCLSIHQDGQLLLGPHHADTDHVHAGSPADKVAYATDRLLSAAEAAAELEVDTVVGFVGCEDYTRSFPWPDPDGWERMLPTVRERLLPILDHYGDSGVRLALEPHPKQIAYDLESALELVELVGSHEALAFNLDPGNLLLAAVDPCAFVAELGARVVHVHAKDGQRVPHRAHRSGLLARGDWGRPERGFRFRIPGWGDVDWRLLVSELILSDYRGPLVIEHEDPLFGPVDGIQKAIDFLAPLLPNEERQARWW